jgi:hypothetical protein
MLRAPFLGFVALALLLACGGPERQLEQAREQLAAGDYAAASDAANAGLAGGAQGPVAWQLELVALESEARGAKGAEALARLTRLAGGDFAAQLNGPLYVQTAGQLKDAGDAAGAINVLDAGVKRFPGDTDLSSAIERAKETGGDAERERLRSLGYVE